MSRYLLPGETSGRDAFPSVIPGWHQNKDNWNTIILDGSIPDDAIKNMIADSYDLVTYNPTRRIYEAVKRIPKGCVATYAQVAELAGNKKMCRAVGNALHKNPNPDEIPCYRVVNAKGELSGAFAFGGADEQANRLRADGIEVIDGRVDLDKYGIRIVDDVIYTNNSGTIYLNNGSTVVFTHIFNDCNYYTLCIIKLFLSFFFLCNNNSLLLYI